MENIKPGASNFVDPDYLPFTTDELVRALQLVIGEEDAKRFAAEVDRVARATEHAHHTAAESRDAGKSDPAEVNPPAWFVGEEIFAILWCVPDFAERTDALMEQRHRRYEKSRLRSELALRGLAPEAEPPADLKHFIRRMVGRHRAAWTRRKRAMADRIGVRRPDGTHRKA